MRHYALGTRLARTGLGVFAAFALAQPASADWWSENFEVHGFARTTTAFVSPSFDFSDAIQLNSWRTELNLEVSADIYSGDELSVSAFAVLRPSYDAIYDLYPDLYGKRARGGDPGTETGGVAGLAAIREGLRGGDSIPGGGAQINGQFQLVNQDTAFLLSGVNNPGIIIDDQVFFGSRVAPFTPRSSRVPDIGGKPTFQPFDIALTNLTALGVQANPNFVNLQSSLNMAATSLNGGVAPATPAQQSALLAAGQIRSAGLIEAGLPAFGDRGQVKQLPFGANDRESQLATDCFDNAHPYCFLREFYFDIEYKNSLLRIGKQQIVWGKADNFRLQDIINPLDLGQNSIFVSLEEQRIPTLAADLITSLGNVGPFQDVSLELVWVFDRFLPIQVGQCGEPRAFVGACEGRADLGAGTVLGVSLSEVKERDWQLKNTEPGFRVEFLLPDPAIAFSVSGFWGFQDAGVTRIRNPYSVDNPNPAGLLLVQALSAAQNAPIAAVPAFDPTDPASIRAAGQALRATFQGLAQALCAPFIAANDVLGLTDCIGGNNAAATSLQPFYLPFSNANFVLEYPRVFTLGASADYQIPGADAILRYEMAYDFDRKFQDSGEPDGLDESDVISAVIGIDFNPFIPFLSPYRTSFVTGQLFVQHILQHDDDGQNRRFIPQETNATATLAMQNFFRNDGVILTNFVAYDFGAQALAFGPSVKWILSERVFFEFGANIVTSRRQKRGVRNLCAGGDLNVACVLLQDGSDFQAGSTQALNLGFARQTETPFVDQRAFGDRLAENRDEIFFSLTYQF